MTITELLKEWMVNEQRERIRSQTYDRYMGLIEHHIVPAIGDDEVEVISRHRLNSFLFEKRHDGGKNGTGLAPASTNLMLSILNMAFEYACDREIIESNPCERVKRAPMTNSRTVDAFTKEEQRRIEQTIETEDEDRLFGIVLCLYTGLRIGELLGLEWEDLNESCTLLNVSKTVYRSRDENGEWQVCVGRPKTRSSQRCIPLPEHISLKLNELRKRSKSRFVISNKKGERMPTRSYQYIFESITRKAQVRRLNFHATRHTFATRALENGMDIKTLSEIMGHKDASITLNRYAHSMLETKTMMMRRMTKIV